MLRHRIAAVVSLALLAVTITACSDGDGSSPLSGENEYSSQGVELPYVGQYSKADVFDDYTVSPPPITLDGSTAYIASTNALSVVDTRSGETLTEITSADSDLIDPEGQTARQKLQAPPRGEVDGQPAVFTAFPLRDQEDTVAEVQILAVSTENQKVLRDLRVPIKEGSIGAIDTGEVRLILTDKNRIAVVISESEAVGTYMYDSASGEVVWWSKWFIAHTAYDDVLVGTEPERYDSTEYNEMISARTIEGDPEKDAVIARDAHKSVYATETAWTLDPEKYFDYRIVAANEKTFWVATTIASNLDPAILEISSTGKLKRVFPSEATFDTYIHRCEILDNSYLVCGESFLWNEIAVYDLTTGKPLWTLKEAHNANSDAAYAKLPVLTSVRDGKIYGLTKAHKPVVLDPRTGKTLPQNPGVAPYIANDSVAIALNDEYIFNAYPAT